MSKIMNHILLNQEQGRDLLEKQQMESDQRSNPWWKELDIDKECINEWEGLTANEAESTPF